MMTGSEDEKRLYELLGRHQMEISKLSEEFSKQSKVWDNKEKEYIARIAELEAENKSLQQQLQKQPTQKQKKPNKPAKNQGGSKKDTEARSTNSGPQAETASTTGPSTASNVSAKASEPDDPWAAADEEAAVPDSDDPWCASPVQPSTEKDSRGFDNFRGGKSKRGRGGKRGGFRKEFTKTEPADTTGKEKKNGKDWKKHSKNSKDTPSTPDRSNTKGKWERIPKKDSPEGSQNTDQQPGKKPTETVDKKSNGDAPKAVTNASEPTKELENSIL